MVRKTNPEPGDPTAGNGILSRRIFLEGALVVGATGAGLSCASAEPLAVHVRLGSKLYRPWHTYLRRN
jgi:sulfane dehydrogenase subunit SoxC